MGFFVTENLLEDLFQLGDLGFVKLEHFFDVVF